MQSSASVTVIIPAYNEGTIIGKIIQSLKKLYPDYEILLINDGSLDDTALKAKNAGAQVISHPKKRGYGASLKTGIQNAQGELIVFFDGDGQHDPQDVGRLVKAFAEKDMVVGARPRNTGSFYRRMGKWLLTQWVKMLTGKKIPDLNSGLRILKRSLALELLGLLPDGFSLTTTLTLLSLKQNYRLHYLPIRVFPRIGRSTLNSLDFFKILRLVLKIWRSTSLPQKT